MNNTIRIIIFSLFVLVFNPHAFATTYYVSNDGSDNSMGMEELPWRTIQHAAEIAKAEDIILVNNGFYSGFYTVNSGWASKPITFKANGPRVVINSANNMTSDCINVEGTDYIVIDGFQVTNSSRDGVRVVNARGVTVKNCAITNSSRFGILTGWAPEVSIINNAASDNGEHGIYVSNSNVTDDNPIIRGNAVFNSGQNGIQVNGDICEGGDGSITGALIENNIVHDSYWKGLSLISMSNSMVRNNIIYNNGTSNAGAGGIHVVEQGTCPDQGIIYSNNNNIVNNTIVEPRIAAIRINAKNVNNVLFNNICISSNMPIALEGGGNYADANSNLQKRSAAGVFVNAAAGGDYHLSDNSPALNKGKTSYRGKSAPAQDYEANIRPSGSTYDSGAYEK